MPARESVAARFFVTTRQPRVYQAMKLLVAALALAACASDDLAEDSVDQDLNGDTWTTIDDAQGPNNLGAANTGVAIGAQGKVFVVGSRNETAGGSSWTIRASNDNGLHWALNSTYALATGMNASAWAIAIGAGNNIYITGYAIDDLGASHWIIRRSNNAGGQWSTVLDTPEPAGTTLAPGGSLAVVGGYIYALASTVTNGVTTSVVIGQPAGGSGWTTVTNPFSNVVFQGLCGTSIGLVGVGSYNNGNDNWISFASSDGINWRMLETLGTATVASACTESNGALYVGGVSSTGASHQWIVHRSTNGGSSWTPVDALASPYYGAPEIMGPGPGGKTYAVGQLGVSLASASWHVRKTATGTSWNDSDDYLYAGSNVGNATGFAYSTTIGTTFVVGSSGGHAIVRYLN